jgi:hypothetical protein
MLSISLKSRQVRLHGMVQKQTLYAGLEQTLHVGRRWISVRAHMTGPARASGWRARFA